MFLAEVGLFCITTIFFKISETRTTKPVFKELSHVGKSSQRKKVKMAESKENLVILINYQLF
jgi:hypothetical protein